MTLGGYINYSNTLLSHFTDQNIESLDTKITGRTVLYIMLYTHRTSLRFQGLIAIALYEGCLVS